MFENTLDNSIIAIFGAQGIALGAYRALRQVCPQREIPCFVVSKRGMNAKELDGVPVLELDEFLSECNASTLVGYGNRVKTAMDCESGNGNNKITDCETGSNDNKTTDCEIGSNDNKTADCETGNNDNKTADCVNGNTYNITNVEIMIATPENVMPEIEELLDNVGLNNHTRLTSVKWAELMRMANEKTGEFLPLDMQPCGKFKADIEFYMAKFYRDKPLNSDYKIPEWITPIQVGAALTKERVADILDSDGNNISSKNVNYSELTALYWVWKHRLEQQEDGVDKTVSGVMGTIDKEVYAVTGAAGTIDSESGTVAGATSEFGIAETVDAIHSKYYGLVHYRRILELTDEDLLRLNENDIDVVLPYPMPYLPDIHAHHERYLSSHDWNALLTALRELQPEYADKVSEIFGQQYLYNYNIMLAKKEVLRDYCRFLFPVLARTEELSSPKGWERADRYIGYMGENLTTLYFMVNKDKLKVMHTGCRFLI